MLSEPKGGWIFEAPKSGKGRSIRLTRNAVSALKQHRKRQLEERMQKAGSGPITGSSFPLPSERPTPAATSTALSRPRSSVRGSRKALAFTTSATRALRSS